MTTDTSEQFAASGDMTGEEPATTEIAEANRPQSVAGETPQARQGLEHWVVENLMLGYSRALLRQALDKRLIAIVRDWDEDEAALIKHAQEYSDCLRALDQFHTLEELTP